jgi:hypothetical protein
VPLHTTVNFKNESVSVELTTFRDIEFSQGFSLMNEVIIEGKSWPFLEPFQSIESYKLYFHSHASFVVRFQDQQKYGDNNFFLYSSSIYLPNSLASFRDRHSRLFLYKAKLPWAM